MFAPKKIQAVLFDLDGVLIDTFHAWHKTLQETLRLVGHPPISFERFKKDFGQGTNEDSQGYTQGKVKTEILERLYTKVFARFSALIKVNPDAPGLLRWLKNRKIKTACVTNSNKKVASRTLKNSRLLKKLDLLVTPGAGIRPKPHPSMILKALELLEVSNESVLMVGDSAFDLQAAKAAGVTFVALGRKIPGSDAYLPRLGQLKSLLRKS